MSDAVEATYVKDIDTCGNLPGAWSFYRERNNDRAGIIYICPCGCGKQGMLPIEDGSGEIRRRWKFNGSLEKPTLEPSVRDSRFTGEKRIEHWHGWLRNGNWLSI